jgi:hypothetical protein
LAALCTRTRQEIQDKALHRRTTPSHRKAKPKTKQECGDCNRRPAQRKRKEKKRKRKKRQEQKRKEKNAELRRGTACAKAMAVAAYRQAEHECYYEEYEDCDEGECENDDEQIASMYDEEQCAYYYYQDYIEKRNRDIRKQLHKSSQPRMTFIATGSKSTANEEMHEDDELKQANEDTITDDIDNELKIRRWIMHQMAVDEN